MSPHMDRKPLLPSAKARFTVQGDLLGSNYTFLAEIRYTDHDPPRRV